MRRRARVAGAAAAAVAAAFAAFWTATAPDPLEPSALPHHTPDRANGERLYHAGSCSFCHRARSGDLPTGEVPFRTPVASFDPGNLTPDAETGIGRWSAIDFVNAMARGVSPEGRHYFPAFPYTSFRFMTPTDLLDLRAYLMSLPPTRSPRPPSRIPLERVVRRGVGLWKQLAWRERPPAAPTGSSSVRRGAYLVNAPGHCGECHTPRNLLMLPDGRRRFEGGPHPAGEGRVPSLLGLVARGRYRDAADLATALRFGETYGYDGLSSGGMGRIQQNLALLPESDTRAIADYLVSLETSSGSSEAGAKADSSR